MSQIAGTFGALWGVFGVLLLLVSAVYRLAPMAVDAFQHDLQWHHWCALFIIIFLMAYAEGYVGFQRRFSPRVAARAKYLMNNPRALHVLLAPLFCIGYFHSTKKRKITSISLTTGIIVLIIAIRLLSQPWRGIIDAGVVVGLMWGILSLIVYIVYAFKSKEFQHPPELPVSEH